MIDRPYRPSRLTLVLFALLMILCTVGITRWGAGLCTGDGFARGVLAGHASMLASLALAKLRRSFS